MRRLAAGRPCRVVSFVLAVSLVAGTALLPARARAQETEILRAIEAGEIRGTSLLAVPEAPAAAPAPAGASGAAPAIAAPPATAAPPMPMPMPMRVRSPDDILSGIAAWQERDIVDRAYPLLASKWPFNLVYVCWEDPAPEDRDHRALVRQAVAESWEANSGLRLRGWNTCTPTSTGIRIAVEDVGPHVKFLGKFVDGQANGMVLNFTFRNWSPSCQAKVDDCIRSIAVHEFGHAIGFAHEQNRPDTPGECFEPAQGPDGDTIRLTPWDPLSVMNYCNPLSNNDGVLSAFDIVAVQYIYGAP